jgi:hypothetical protein
VRDAVFDARGVSKPLDDVGAGGGTQREAGAAEEQPVGAAYRLWPLVQVQANGADRSPATPLAGIADRHDAFAAALTLEPNDELALVELNLVERQRDGLADAYAGVQQDQEQSFVAGRQSRQPAGTPERDELGLRERLSQNLRHPDPAELSQRIVGQDFLTLGEAGEEVQRVDEHGCTDLAATRTTVHVAAEPLERGANIDGVQRIERGLDVLGVGEKRRRMAQVGFLIE